jgi:DHA2 family multidrug resistance protein-like MFS transporter
LTILVAAPLAGRLANRISTASLCAAGSGFLTLGLAGAALLPFQERALALIVALTMLCGLGFGLFNVPNNRNMFLSAPPERSGAAGGLQGTARLTGQTAGVLIMTTLFVLLPIDLAPRVGLGIAALFAMAAGLVSILRINSTLAVSGFVLAATPTAESVVAPTAPSLTRQVVL